MVLVVRDRVQVLSREAGAGEPDVEGAGPPHVCQPQFRPRSDRETNCRFLGTGTRPSGRISAGQATLLPV